MIVKAVLLALALTLPLGGARAANWTVTDLGALGQGPNPGSESIAWAINNSGQVLGLGTVTDGSKPWSCVLWANGVQQDLGLPSGNSSTDGGVLNDAGQAVCHLGGVTYFWQSGTLAPLPTLPGGPWISGAHAINNLGVVVGWNMSWANTADSRAVRWQGGVPSDLGFPGSAHGGAIGVNDAGSILVQTGDVYRKPYVLTGSVSNVVDIAGSVPRTNISPEDLNHAGQVCGYLVWDGAVSATRHAFVWAGGVATLLPEYSGNESEAWAMNNLGHVLGQSHIAGVGWKQLVWREGAMLNLTDLPEFQAAGFSGISTRDINDSGQIVGYGWVNGSRHAFLLSPIAALTPFDLTLTRHGTNVTLSFPTQTGYRYQLLSSTDVASKDWIQVGAPFTGTGGVLSTGLPLGPESAMFFRVQAGD